MTPNKNKDALYLWHESESHKTDVASTRENRHSHPVRFFVTVNKGFAQTDDIVNGVESVLKPEENDIALRIEYMDSKATKYDSRYKEKIYELYKYKYGNQTFELHIF